MRAAIEQGQPVQCDADRAWPVEEMLVAVHESARRDGQWIELPLTELTSIEKDMHADYLKLYGHAWNDIDGPISAALPRGGVRWSVLGDL
jgi:hypothetical protein